MSAAEEFIRTRMALTPLAVRPDISIFRATPQSGLQGWLARQGHEAAPYWAYAWGGGAALALHLRDHPEAVAGKSVVDLGAGSGLVGIAAMKAGASSVFAIESDAIGQVAVRLNAEANGATVALWAEDGLPEADVVLAGDVFYDAAVAAVMLPKLQASAALVLIGDPFRKTLPLDALEQLAGYEVPDFGSGDTPVPAGVFALRPRTI